VLHPPAPARGIVWRWPAALFGAVCALPAGLVALEDVPRGLAMAFGTLPAALVGVAPTRRARLAVVLLGILTGVPMLVGGLLAGVPVLAVAAIFALGLAAALFAARSRLGTIVMTVSLPLVGVGLSYDDVGEAAALAGLMVGGSVFAYLVSLPWPVHAAASRPAGGVRPTPGYGLLLGAAGATAAAIGFIADLDHVGWACAAALLVMRPSAEMQRLRSAGRPLAVAVGALAAIALVRLDPADGYYALVIVAVLAGAAGTRGSRWYVTPAFTTCLVFLLLLYSEPGDAESRFNERLLETLLGVGIAYLFGLVVPRLLERRRRPRGAT
jgi:hypothetical protein